MGYTGNSDAKNYDRSDVVQLHRKELKSRKDGGENRRPLVGRAMDRKFNDLRF